MVNKVENASWTATEYIARNHNFLWYLGLIIVSAGLGALAVF